MNEAFVQLACPDCEKHWEDEPMDLPAPDAEFTCPDCGEQRRTSEFMRTDRDLEILQELTEA
jgi:ssDNA-binding Zn-finger/Zn-ribbon topoisomerase 1